MEEFVYFYGTYITREEYDKWYEEHYGRKSMEHKNLSEMLDEKKGLLLIDGAYNTLLIPLGSNEMEELAADFIHKNLKYVRKNKLKSDLNKSIKEYLAKEYVNKERDEG